MRQLQHSYNCKTNEIGVRSLFLSRIFNYEEKLVFSYFKLFENIIVIAMHQLHEQSFPEFRVMIRLY